MLFIWGAKPACYATLTPAGTGFQSIVRLRDDVRGTMLVRSGEPELGELARPEPMSPAA
jgi:hypothetical protein